MKQSSRVTPILVSFIVWVGVAIAAPKLAGSEWAPSTDSKQFIQFQSDGRVVGHGGCNRFFGTYSQTNLDLKIGPLGATKMLCPDNVMQQETAMFAILAQAVRFERKAHKLVLYDGAGQQIAQFRQRDWD